MEITNEDKVFYICDLEFVGRKNVCWCFDHKFPWIEGGGICPKCCEKYGLGYYKKPNEKGVRRYRLGVNWVKGKMHPDCGRVMSQEESFLELLAFIERNFPDFK